jgi:hypothetical protein
MAIVQGAAREILDVESVGESIIQKNAIAQQYNVYTARIHMKHGDMNVLHGSLRGIDLGSCGSDPASSLSNLFLFYLPRLSFCEEAVRKESWSNAECFWSVWPRTTAVVGVNMFYLVTVILS